MEMSAEQRDPWFLGPAMVFHGWAVAARGQIEDGIDEARQGIARCRDRDALTWLPLLLGLQSETCLRARRPDGGLPYVSEALELADRTGQRCWQAELKRIKGELLLAVSSDNRNHAERCFSRAFDSARHPGARSWELRAATSLARLWQDEGNREDARKLLAPIYGAFTEGFETPDLRDAKALLASLS